MKQRLNIVVSLLLLMTVGNVYAASVAELTDMLKTLQTNIPALMVFVTAFCYTIGIWFMLKAVYMLKKYGQMRTMMALNVSIAKPAIVMLVGVGCIYLPGLIDAGMSSLWVAGSSSVLKYPTGGGEWEAVINPLIDVVRLFGFVAFIRGWIMLAKYGAENAQPGTAGKAMMHLIGGLLAMNIVGAWDMVKATLGVS